MTEAHINNLLCDIREYQLETTPQFEALTIAELDKIYNGCGPDWLNEKLRGLLTEYFEFYESAFLVHDVEFQYSDKTREGFSEANLRLYRNCKKLVRSQLSWWISPRAKLRSYIQCRIIYRSCQNFGFSAWIN